MARLEKQVRHEKLVVDKLKKEQKELVVNSNEVKQLLRNVLEVKFQYEDHIDRLSQCDGVKPFISKILAEPSKKHIKVARQKAEQFIARFKQL